LRADTRSAAKDTVFLLEVIIVLDVPADEFVKFVSLAVEHFEHFLDAVANVAMMHQRQAGGKSAGRPTKGIKIKLTLTTTFVI
jgi:hypothetical protein